MIEGKRYTEWKGVGRHLTSGYSELEEAEEYWMLQGTAGDGKTGQRG
jgi:hypothetical protein